MQRLLIPKKLNPGDKVATVSSSWGGPGTIPERYQIGKKQLEEEFDLEVVEARHALKDAAWLDQNPQARAEDLMESFADPEIKAIISTIGGEDSVRMLPFIDPEIIRNNPKIYLGYSDSTITHVACLNAGIRSYYGPSVMTGFAENCGIFPYLVDSIRRTLFSSSEIGVIKESAGWTVEHLEWSEAKNQDIKRKLNPPLPWNYLQGDHVVEGHLIGGCADVLEMLKGTPYWPSEEMWSGGILFLENSEDAISPAQFRYWLRNYGTMGVLNLIKGILFSRPGGNIPVDKFGEYDAVLQKIVNEEFGRKDLPIVTRMDFGHTDPMFVIPYGAQARLDPLGAKFEILESGVL